MQMTSITGLDIAKSVFQVHCVDRSARWRPKLPVSTSGKRGRCGDRSDVYWPSGSAQLLRRCNLD